MLFAIKGKLSRATWIRSKKVPAKSRDFISSTACAVHGGCYTGQIKMFGNTLPPNLAGYSSTTIHLQCARLAKKPPY